MDLEKLASLYPFKLDPFQIEAIESIEDGKNVIVCAPTGSGKTVVAEYAVRRALARGRRCFYTTPLKALSNQKFGDLRRLLGDDQV
ncbi:DEAD/DEAH box helicase, partial [bacterium]|nr:DEAD/DEAH box helicase [bacterium]